MRRRRRRTRFRRSLAPVRPVAESSAATRDSGTRDSGLLSNPRFAAHRARQRPIEVVAAEFLARDWEEALHASLRAWSLDGDNRPVRPAPRAVHLEFDDFDAHRDPPRPLNSRSSLLSITPPTRDPSIPYRTFAICHGFERRSAGYPAAYRQSPVVDYHIRQGDLPDR